MLGIGPQRPPVVVRVTGRYYGDEPGPYTGFLPNGGTFLQPTLVLLRGAMEASVRAVSAPGAVVVLTLVRGDE